MSEELRHLKGSNLKVEVSHCIGYVHFWSLTFDSVLRELVAKTDADIRTAKEVADNHSGWRCAAVELLLSPYCAKMSQLDRLNACEAIATAGIDPRDFEQCQKAIAVLNSLRTNLGNHLVFYVSPGTAFNPYLAETEYPAVSILQIDESSALKSPANPKDIMAGCKSAGQRKALEMLANIARVRHEFPDIAGISIPPTAMLVGMSGAGKTWVAKSFAKMSRWPFFETTVSGWSPINSKADAWTLVNIRKMITDSPCVILVDECDKCAVRSGGDGNQNWYSGCLVELQNLLDRQMPDVPGGLSLMQKCHLSRSWILLAGAFQSIYRKKLGGEISFAEELAVEITREDIEAGSGLTTELLNRTGPLIAVAAPTVAEYARELKRINDETGNSRPQKELEAAACEALTEMRGWRGLTDYAICSGIAALKARKTK